MQPEIHKKPQKMELNAAQKQAVEYLEGPLLVLAGPGTGKTQLLSKKVEYILKNTDAAPETILCLTFTENGAQNMRDRLAQTIGQAAGKVRIHTYHAFGSDILMQYKNYATEFDRNLDAAIDTVTQYKMIKNVQDALDPMDIMKHANIKDIIDTIESAKSARLDGKDLEKIAKDNIETTVKINPDLNEHLKNYTRGMKFENGLQLVYQPILETLLKNSSKAPVAKNIEKETNFLARELNEIIETESAKEKSSISPLTSWKTKRFEVDDDGNFRLKNRIANKKLLSLAHIMQQYEQNLAAENLYDFADMIQQTIKILKEDRGFKLTLEEQYQYILLDEFQDTNAAQAELIYELTDYDSPNIMAVGDDDQAIFAFQGANVSNLLDFQNHYNARVITLTENYRSGINVLETSFKIREQIEESFAKAHKIVKKLTAAGVKSSADLERHEFLEASAEYSWVAEKVSELIKNGVKQSEIAIITPKHKYIAPLLPYLRAHQNINIAYEKRDNLFDDQKIHELLTLAKFIYDLPNSPSYLLPEILSFPFFEIPAEDAIKTFTTREKSAKTLEVLENSTNEKIKNLAKLFAKLYQKSETSPLELFLDYLIGTAPLDAEIKSPFLDFYKEQEDYEAFTLYENLHVLREVVQKYSGGQKLTLKNLIDFVHDYQDAGEPLVNTSPYQDAENAVQILTAHKSKGLEFQYVFLIALDDRAWGNAKGNNNFLSLPQNLIQIRHTGITEDERLRLFFVALTRAKTHLIMTNSLKDFSGKDAKRLEYLAEYEDENGDLISPHLPKNALLVNKHYENLKEDQKLADLQTSWLSFYQIAAGNLKNVLKKRLENYQVTATDVTTFIDVVYAGPQIFYQQKLLRAPEESFSEALTFGNLIHATFEQVTNNHLDDTAALEFFEKSAKEATVPPEKLDDILARGKVSLKASLGAFSPILRDKNARAEVNLRHEHLSMNGIPLTGKIDHINIDEDAKTIEVYDFKTSGFHDNKWDRHATLYKYMLQLGFYKLLLNLSPTYSKYKVEKAHILFVVPDNNDEKVHDKIYEYNEKDEGELKRLIYAVYSQVKTLDFLENSELFIPPDQNKGIKDIHDFVEKILDIAS